MSFVRVLWTIVIVVKVSLGCLEFRRTWASGANRWSTHRRPSRSTGSDPRAPRPRPISRQASSGVVPGVTCSRDSHWFRGPKRSRPAGSGPRGTVARRLVAPGDDGGRRRARNVPLERASSPRAGGPGPSRVGAGGSLGRLLRLRRRAVKDLRGEAGVQGRRRAVDAVKSTRPPISGRRGGG